MGQTGTAPIFGKFFRTVVLRRLVISFSSIFLMALPLWGIRPLRHYDVNDGLSDNSVKDIYQDSTGFMWFATKDGLNRFDGNRITVYASSMTGEHTNIDVICPHPDGRHLWLGCSSSLTLFDKQTGEISTFSKASTDSCVIRGCTSLVYDRMGQLWIGSEDNGLFMWSENEDRLVRYSLPSSPHVRSLAIGENGKLWVGTSSGMYGCDPRTGIFTGCYNLVGENADLGDNEFTDIICGEEGCLMVGTQNGSLAEFDPGKELFTLFPYNGAENTGWNISRIHSIFRKSPGVYMIGTDSGMFIFEKEGAGWVSSGDYSLARSSVYKFFKDKEGGLWIGTYFSGVKYISPRQDEILWYRDEEKPGTLHGNAVSEFCEDSKGNIWIATENGGLNCFDPAAGRFTDYSHKSHNNIHALEIVGDKLLIGTFSKGLDCMDLRTGKVRRYMNIPSDTTSLCNNHVYAIHRSSSGEIFVGTLAGLCRFDLGSGKFSRVGITGSDFIYDIAEDRDGNVWFATRVNGIYRYSQTDKTWTCFRHNPSDPSSPLDDMFNRVYVDRNGDVWFCGESSGICRYVSTPPHGRFENFGAEEGLPNGIYYGILDDGTGNLWLSSNKGIVKYTPASRKYVRYTTEDGLQSDQFNFRSSYAASDGTFYFGGINGFNRFSPFKISDNKVRPETVISTVSVRSTGKDGMETVREIVPGEGMLKLHSNVLSLKIEYECLSYVAPGQNRFRWKLEGLNDSWTETEQHSVTFMKLRAGKYRFSVTSYNNNGYESSSEPSVEFKVLAPPWQSAFAKTGYAVLLIGVILLVLKYMNDRERERKEKEVFKAKIDFFTQIAHEIKTPVTLIKAPLEQVMGSGHLSNGIAANLTMIQKNVNRLLELISQLLDFRKIDSEGYRLSCSNTDVSAIVADTVARFRDASSDTGNTSGKTEIITSLPQKHIVMVADREALIKIISNLLANALKYARSEITVSADYSGQMLSISVDDDGPGIPDGIRDKVFQPFFQGAPYSGNGFGIGLSLVKILVDKHGGHISIGTNSCGGCRVTVEIPDMGTSAASAEVSVQEQEEPAPAHADRYTVMIVEDTPDMRDFLVRNFEETYNVLAASDGMQALEILSRKSCDLIISDILMPVMDGFTFLEKVRQDRMLSHIPFILLSALDSADSKVRGLESGADTYVEKPFSLVYLKACVESLLENRKRISEHFASTPEMHYGTDEIPPQDEKWLDKLNSVISGNLTNEGFSVETLAEMMAMSRSNLQRKIKGLTGMIPTDYIRLIRLKTAAQLLKSGEHRINEVCFLTGFSNMSYFSRRFRQQFGILPREYMKRHQAGGKEDS